MLIVPRGGGLQQTPVEGVCCPPGGEFSSKRSDIDKKRIIKLLFLLFGAFAGEFPPGGPANARDGCLLEPPPRGAGEQRVAAEGRRELFGPVPS